MILTNKNGNEIRALEYTLFDFDMNDDKSFAIEMPASEYKNDLVNGARIFKENTEYGGLIGGFESYSEDGYVRITGRTWRGILDKKIIRPDSGQDYKTVSGDVNTIIRNFLDIFGLTSLFSISETNLGISVTNYQFDRYCTFYEGICKMLKSLSLKMVLAYDRGDSGQSGKVHVSVEPVIDYSLKDEISNSSTVYFTIKVQSDGVNHLICLGQGELKDREVVDLFIDKNGNVSQTQYFTGINEVVEVYDYKGADDTATLIEYGRRRLLEASNSQYMSMDIYQLGYAPLIGDIVGGRDKITGISMKQPIVNIIYKEEKGSESLQYVVDGDSLSSYDL